MKPGRSFRDQRSRLANHHMLHRDISIRGSKPLSQPYHGEGRKIVSLFYHLLHLAFRFYIKYKSYLNFINHLIHLKFCRATAIQTSSGLK